MPSLRQRLLGVFGSSLPKKDQEEFTRDIQNLRSAATGNRLVDYFVKAVTLQQDREMRYRDYDDMIEDPRVAGAVELITDDATQYSKAKKKTIWVESKKKEIVEVCTELFDILKVEENLWDWAFFTAYHGDFFLEIFGENGKGITSVADDIHSADIERYDVNGVLVGFRYRGESGQSSDEVILREPWDFVHFRISGTQKRIRTDSGLWRSRYYKDNRKFRYTTKYGMSIIEPARYVYKILHLGELSLGMARVARAGLQRMHKIPVGKSKPKDWPDIIRQVKAVMEQDESLQTNDPKDYSSLYSPLKFAQDVFIPVPEDGRFDINTEDLSQDTDIRGIVDLEYWRNMLFGGLKVPKAFLGYEESLPGGLGETALLRLDIRYARTVKRVYRAIISGMKRLCMIHLAYKGIEFNEEDFDCYMDMISTAEEEERKSILESGIDVVDGIKTLLSDLDVEYDKKAFVQFVLKDILSDAGIDYDVLKIKMPEETTTEGVVNELVEEVKNNMSTDKLNEKILSITTRRELVHQAKYGSDYNAYLPSITEEEKEEHNKEKTMVESTLIEMIKNAEKEKPEEEK